MAPTLGELAAPIFRSEYEAKVMFLQNVNVLFKNLETELILTVNQRESFKLTCSHRAPTPSLCCSIGINIAMQSKGRNLSLSLHLAFRRDI